METQKMEVLFENLSTFMDGSAMHRTHHPYSRRFMSSTHKISCLFAPDFVIMRSTLIARKWSIRDAGNTTRSMMKFMRG